MCNFFSGVIGYKHKKVYYDIDLDSHSDILEKFKIKDNKKVPNFVKFEVTPSDGDVFNHDRDNWNFEVDNDFSQDIVPDWFDQKRASEQAWIALQDVFKKRFLIDAKMGELKEGRWYVKDSKNIQLENNTIIEILNNSQVNYMRGNSQVNYMRDNSQVNYMRGNSQVNYMRGNSQVNDMRGNSQVNDMRGNSQVNYMWDNSKVNDMWGNSQVNDMRGNSIMKRGLKITVV